TDTGTGTMDTDTGTDTDTGSDTATSTGEDTDTTTGACQEPLAADTLMGTFDAVDSVSGATYPVEVYADEATAANWPSIGSIYKIRLVFLGEGVPEVPEAAPGTRTDRNSVTVPVGGQEWTFFRLGENGEVDRSWLGINRGFSGTLTAGAGPAYFNLNGIEYAVEVLDTTAEGEALVRLDAGEGNVESTWVPSDLPYVKVGDVYVKVPGMEGENVSLEVCEDREKTNASTLFDETTGNLTEQTVTRGCD
ncbi:hypothetical protein GF412_00925, partial [Candidatus Micrarchaeota archaeon]|nr:hypothetical protein [Candidatus Micrarchaeota archaeon]